MDHQGSPELDFVEFKMHVKQQTSIILLMYSNNCETAEALLVYISLSFLYLQVLHSFVKSDILFEIFLCP